MASLVLFTLFLFFGFALGMFREEDTHSEPETENTELSYENRCVYDFTEHYWGHGLSSWRQDSETGLAKVLGHGPSSSPIEGVDPHQGFIDAGKEFAKMGGSYSINMPKHLKKGDLLRIRNKDKSVIDWEVVEVQYKRDPRDMFSATLKGFAVVEDPDGIYEDLEDG